MRARQGKLKAVKAGRNWVTCERWLKEYIKRAEKYNKRFNREPVKKKNIIMKEDAVNKAKSETKEIKKEIFLPVICVRNNFVINGRGPEIKEAKTLFLPAKRTFAPPENLPIEVAKEDIANKVNGVDLIKPALLARCVSLSILALLLFGGAMFFWGNSFTSAYKDSKIVKNRVSYYMEYNNFLSSSGGLHKKLPNSLAVVVSYDSDNKTNKLSEKATQALVEEIIEAGILFKDITFDSCSNIKSILLDNLQNFIQSRQLNSY